MTLGAVCALAAWLVVPGGVAPPLAMIGGMAVGVVAAIPLFGVLTYHLGGFEIIVLAMQVGMVAGMAGAMMGSASTGVVAATGAVVGLVVEGALHALERALHGEVVDA